MEGENDKSQPYIPTNIISIIKNNLIYLKTNQNNKFLFFCYFSKI